MERVSPAELCDDRKTPEGRGRRDALPDGRSDEELMEAFLGGDQKCLAVLFMRYQKPLSHYACRVLGDRHLADDVVNELFLKFLRNPPRYERGKRLKPLLYVIACHLTIDFLRRRSRQKRELPLSFIESEEDGVMDAGMFPDPKAPLPEEVAQSAEEMHCIRQAVERLPPLLRQIIQIVLFEGLSYREAAEALGIPIGTVKSRLHSAKEALRANDDIQSLRYGVLLNVRRGVPVACLEAQGYSEDYR